MMEYVIGALWSGLELFCCFLFNGAFLPQKGFNKNCVYKVLIVWIFVCIYTNIPINQFVKQVLTVVVYTILSMILYRGTYGINS